MEIVEQALRPLLKMTQNFENSNPSILPHCVAESYKVFGFEFFVHMTNLKPHPAADAFPMMEQKRLNELKQDIEKNGLQVPIVISEGMILDGRNRFKACLELGLEPSTKTYDGDPWSFVWSLNGTRRDLVAEQRYLIWKHCHEQSETYQAEKRRIETEANRKRSEAAKVQHEVSNPRAGESMVKQQTVAAPKKAKADEHPNAKNKATESKTNLGAVQRGDQLYKERPDLAKKVMAGDIKPAEAHRQMKKDQVSAKVEDLPKDKFNVIYADPPWKYNDSQAVKGDYGSGTGAANSHYPSMTLSELKALDIPSMTADDSVLFLWATCPLLEDALELLKAWGFKYKAQFVWDKVKHNMGHYNSVRHELLLICTKGSCTPENVKLFDSVQSIERTEHSRKPEEFRDIINTLYPSFKKIELFRRGEAPEGWSVWGNEAL
jgi:N6-adenosine-specific RNA methylase IME4